VSPLCAAAAQGSTEVIDVLVEAGADVDLACPDGTTPLHAAVLAGRLAPVQQLLRYGSDPDKGRLDGTSPLLTAVKSKNDDVIEELVDAGAVANAVVLHGRDAGVSVLHVAAANGDGVTIRRILNRGLGIDDPLSMLNDAGRRTLLPVAVRMDSVRLVHDLLALGVDPNVRDAHGHTPVEWAVLLGHVNPGALLAEAGADVLDSPPVYSTRHDVEPTGPLHRLAWAADAVDEAVFQYYDPNSIRDPIGRTPLHYAAARAEGGGGGDR
jgi:ankyrin repeat protein